MACSSAGPPRGLLSKASFICLEQKDGFTSTTFPPFKVPGPLVSLFCCPHSPEFIPADTRLPSASPLPSNFSHKLSGGLPAVSFATFMFTCIHVRLPPQPLQHKSRAKRWTAKHSFFLTGLPPSRPCFPAIERYQSEHTCTFICVTVISQRG